MFVNVAFVMESIAHMISVGEYYDETSRRRRRMIMRCMMCVARGGGHTSTREQAYQYAGAGIWVRKGGHMRTLCSRAGVGRMVCGRGVHIHMHMGAYTYVYAAHSIMRRGA